MSAAMIVLFTDFGASDLYVGQVKAVLASHARPGTLVIDLLHEVPSFDVAAGAHLLAATRSAFPAGAVFLCVVDPGVGGNRGAVALRADEQWFVGPDNGLLSVVAQRASRSSTWKVAWRPAELSVSFHGRDLFAPVAAWLASGPPAAGRLEPIEQLEQRLPADDLPRVIYIDHYGNVITGIRARSMGHETLLGVAGGRLRYARVFSDAPPGEAFWYGNSMGLIEIAAPRASAAALLGLRVGDPVTIAIPDAD
jgi:hypothetical protein